MATTSTRLLAGAVLAAGLAGLGAGVATAATGPFVSGFGIHQVHGGATESQEPFTFKFGAEYGDPVGNDDFTRRGYGDPIGDAGQPKVFRP
ncbi:hypothetical protein WDY80_23405 (plasmid) [Gordonia hongkongensis]|uniref:hypothetical protein n=1 Tax=Gordonia hongkongensis TaxID=1701090 RepID=UPI0030CD4492